MSGHGAFGRMISRFPGRIEIRFSHSSVPEALTFGWASQEELYET
jgi:hypothetical protein